MLARRTMTSIFAILFVTSIPILAQRTEQYSGARVISGQVIVKFKTPEGLVKADEIRDFRTRRAAEVLGGGRLPRHGLLAEQEHN